MSRIQKLFQFRQSPSQLGIAVIAAAVFSCGLWWHHAGLLGGGAVGLCVAFRSFGEQIEEDRRMVPNRRNRKSVRTHLESAPQADAQPAGWLAEPQYAGLPDSPDALVDELLASGRYALLLRPEMSQHLERGHIVRAVRQLDEAMGLVPAGRVLLGPLAEQSSTSGGAVDADPRTSDRCLHRVGALYLDRHPVTNEQFQQFVDAGGYEKLEYWDEEALPALLDFVDQTGRPGPRFWMDGRYATNDQRRPVVGVSWYEASAYGRWVGKRMPTDAEWTKAGAWPVESAPGRIAQRRYPWGESFDIRRANLWGSQRKVPVDVDEYSDGVSVGGIHQLVGNVWEWTSSALALTAEPTFHVPETYKSVRGGAYDTYFENHATCHYQSGEHPLARRHNIGFRLALPMSTLEVAESQDDSTSDDAKPVESEEHIAATPQQPVAV
jgi:formylglycine-generating enzyme required for sulfatase activity